MKTPNRKDILLRAAFDLLRRSEIEDKFYGLSATEVLTRYDEANCDGFCLRDDIAVEIGIDPESLPIPLVEE